MRFTPSEQSVAEWFGGIDVYLFDQIQKNRFTPNMRILDAGCGSGRNLVYFLRSGFAAFGVDREPSAVTRVRELSRRLAPQPSNGNFQVADIAALPYHAGTFDVVLCNAVLHFAADARTFELWCMELVRVLRPDAFLFARLASDIGIEDRVVPLGGRRFRLPDGTNRFLVNEEFLISTTSKLGGKLFEPLKTVNVQGQRCMTTWCFRKSS